jgi:uncharacterized oxidoreductase
MADLFRETCRAYADRPAYKIGDAWLSYSECAARVLGIAASLRATLQRHFATTGQQPVIAVLLPNSYVALESFFVAAVTHSIVFPLNARLSLAELERGIRASGATILLTSDSYASTLLALDWSATKVETVVWAASAAELPVAHHLVWEPVQSPALDDCQPAWAQHLSVYLHGFNTSGTTGRIKTILHSTDNVVAHTVASIAALGLGGDNEHCWAHIGPMFHVGDAVFVWIATLIGARHVFHDHQLHVGDVARLLANNRVTIVKLVPSMLQIMCGSEALKGLSFPDLKWILTGGAAPDATLIRKTESFFGCDFIQGYGMTEATCHIAFKNETRSPPVEGLRVLPGLDLKIVDENEQIVDAGNVGEIAIKGPTVFDRHVLDGRLEAPVDGFTTDGFYRSGDLGFLDTDGRLHVVGRQKDMINVGGENVFAWEVEHVVNSLPGVKECAAVAMAHELLGEVVELAVVRSSEELSADFIKESCRRQLASFKSPQRVHFVERLPRTPTGKVQKHLIVEQLKQESTAARATLPPAPLGAAEAVRQIVSSYMKGLSDTQIGPDEPLFDAGLDSLRALDLLFRLERHFGTTVPQTLLYDFPTMNALAAHFEAAGQPTTGAPAAGSSGRDGEQAMHSTSSAARRSAIAPVALLLQTVGLLLRPLVLALSIVPILILFDLCAQRLDGFELFVTGPLWLALLLADTMAIVILINRILASPVIQQCELWSPAYFRWLFLHNLLRSLEIPLGVLRGTPILNLFYRLCGANIGRGVQLYSVTLHDLHHIHIGDHTIVGRDVNLQPADIRAGTLMCRQIHVGSGCFIRAGASIFGGAHIPDGATIATLATVTAATSSFDTSKPSPPEVKSGWKSNLRTLVGYLFVGYVVSAAIGLGMLFVQHATRLAGAAVPSIGAVLLPSPHLLANPDHWPLPLVFFASAALAIYLVVPVCFFLLVATCKRTLLNALSPQHPNGAFSLHPTWSHWLFSKLIDVAFFRMHLRLNVMSHVARWNFGLLGTRIGTRPFMAAPYTAEPELLELSDNAMVAGNVSIYGIDARSGLIDRIRVGRSAIVANSCVLQAGAHLGEQTLLGDLSSAGQGDASPPSTISVGAPPRVVGRSRFETDTVSSGRYVLNQSMLCLLQWVCLSISNVAGFVAMGLSFNALVSAVPLGVVWASLLVVPVIPRLVKTAFVPLFKWLLLGKTRAGEYPAYGWHYCRWVLLETVIMDAEPAFLTQLHGTLWLNLLWRALGARVGANACVMASSLGCEFDLKEIGSDAVLQYQSLVFGHSIEHHALLFKPAKIGDRAEIGACAIVEAGAVVDAAGVVPPSKPVHARQSRPASEADASSQTRVAWPATSVRSPPLQADQDNSPTFDPTELAAMMRGIFIASGSSDTEAAIVADHLVEANLRGHDSHGIGMLPIYLRNLAMGTLRANRFGRITSSDGSLIVYDGEHGYGQVVARAATEVAIEQARRSGIAVMALRNAHHIGRIGTYGEMCADAGLVSIHFVNITDQRPTVAPWRGGDARFGTNPVCIAVPAAEPGRPLILDMATSVVALGKVRVARNKRQQLPSGVLLDAAGQPTTDPKVMYRQPRGALVTFGEHKGYALALICEILGGAITGGGTMRPENQAAGTPTNGMLTFVVDPARLVDSGWLTSEIKAMTDYVTASPPISPDAPVLIPGDPERQSRARRMADGVPLDEETWREIVEAANRLSVPVVTPRGVVRR